MIVPTQPAGTPADLLDFNIRFQNNIQSIFSRVRLLYGATPIEDIINYNVIVRCLTEWTGTCTTGTMDQTTINEGIGGSISGQVILREGLQNVRQTIVHGYSIHRDGGGNPVFVIAPNNTLKRRYQVNLALGMFTQDKLIPTKFMASQLALEFTLANPDSCMMIRTTLGTLPPALPRYRVSNVNLIPEILEFDSSYDMMFLKGLREGGVPIKFSSWYYYLTLGIRFCSLPERQMSIC